MRLPRRRGAHALTRLLALALLATGFAPSHAGGTRWPSGFTAGVLREVSLEGSSAPRRAGVNEVSPLDTGDGPVTLGVGEPPSEVYDATRQADLSLSRTSIPGLPKNAKPIDVRMDVVIPDTTLGSADTFAHGTHEEFRSGKTLVWCKSFLLSDLLDGEGKLSVVAVEPLPGSGDVHHMHLHVCDEGSGAFSRHKQLFADESGEHKKPLTCAPPSWQPDSGCHGTAWTFLPGQEPVLFPPNVGFTIGGSDDDGDALAVRRVVLEVHYDRAHLMRGRSDQSGLRLWATTDPNDATERVGLLSVADPFARLPQNLPGGQRDVRYTTHCPPGCTKTFEKPMRVFASMTHAHLRARRVLTSVGTPDANGNIMCGDSAGNIVQGDSISAQSAIDGTENDGTSRNTWKTVVSKGSADGSFKHDVQKFIHANFTITPGDALRTECRYDTSGDTKSTQFGPATSQEMCMQVFLYYPKQQPFLCGYYDETKFWCGDADGFVPKTGMDLEKFSEKCEVWETSDITPVTGVSDTSPSTGDTAVPGKKTCAEVEMADAVVSEKNAVRGEGVMM